MTDLLPVLNLLGAIASDLAMQSDREAAVKLAAQALLFIQERRLMKDFDQYIHDFDNELNDEQIKKLKTLGLIES